MYSVIQNNRFVRQTFLYTAFDAQTRNQLALVQSSLNAYWFKIAFLITRQSFSVIHHCVLVYSWMGCHVSMPNMSARVHKAVKVSLLHVTE